MTLKDTCKNLRTLLLNVTSDLDKAETGNKAASQRVRTGTIRLEKIAKLFRKESIKGERGGSSSSSKKRKPAAKSSPAKSKGSAKKSAPKAKPKKAKAKTKTISKKKPTAKILKKSKK